MNGYLLPLTCSYCGGGCVPLSTSMSTGVEARAVAECTECGGEMLVVVVLRPAEGRQREFRARRALERQAVSA